jgi:hypothetical protein
MNRRMIIPAALFGLVLSGPAHANLNVEFTKGLIASGITSEAIVRHNLKTYRKILQLIRTHTLDPRRPSEQKARFALSQVEDLQKRLLRQKGRFGSLLSAFLGSEINSSLMEARNAASRADFAALIRLDFAVDRELKEIEARI